MIAVVCVILCGKPLVFEDSVRRRTPANCIWLVIFTLAKSFLLAFISCNGYTQWVSSTVMLISSASYDGDGDPGYLLTCGRMCLANPYFVLNSRSSGCLSVYSFVCIVFDVDVGRLTEIVLFLTILLIL